MNGLHVDNPTLTVPEQRINYGVLLPRDPAMVRAEAEWADARLARSNGARPRMTADEALRTSRELTAERLGLTLEEYMHHVANGVYEKGGQG